MAAFDPFLDELWDLVDAVAAHHPRREHHWPGDPAALAEGLGIRVGPGANEGIILRSDTFVELGNPVAGSVAMVLWTDDPALVCEGRITVIGPDIADSEGASLPFAQVLVVAGPTLNPADHGALQQCHHIGDEVEGYMLRSTSEHIWGRVSRQVAAKGFDLETLGRAQLHLVRAAQPRVTSAEIVFITAGKEEVRSLGDLAARSKDAGTELVYEVWREQGYDVDCSLDCNACSSKPVCDDVREVLADRLQRQREERVAGPTVRT